MSNSQKEPFRGNSRNASLRFNFSAAAVAEGGVGGAAGRKGAGRAAIVEIMAV